MSLMPYVLAFFPMAMVFVSRIIGKKSRNARNIFAACVGIAECLMALALFIYTMGATHARGIRVQTPMGFCGLGLSFRADGFRSLYALVAAFMWCQTLLLSPQYFAHYHNRNRYYFFNLLTMGATVGLFMTDDLFSTFIFFEIMSFASYPWVAHDQTERAMKAAQTYLAVAVLGGMVTLMGLFMLYHQAGTLTFSGLRYYAAKLTDKSSLYLPGALTLFGFAAKAGVFPMHIWLPKAHPVAPAPASALLSGVLTKTGVFGILVLECNLFYGDIAWGNVMLLLGVITMFLGALLAVFSVDLKKTLACSSMSQIGFIMVGVGCMGLLGNESAVAAQGTVLHMVNHSMLKLVLFMAAGVIYMNTHKLNLNDIRGFGRHKPLLHFAFLMGVLGLMGMPLFNGYISKSLLHEGILEYVHLLHGAGQSAIWYQIAEKVFLITGGMTAAYMTKLYICIFWEKNADAAVQKTYDDNKKYMNKVSCFALMLPAVMLPMMGMLPDVIMTYLSQCAQGFMRFTFHPVAYFSAENLLGAAKSLAIGGLVYAAIRLWLMEKNPTKRAYADRWPTWLDLEEKVYRPLVCKVLPAIGWWISHPLDKLLDCKLTRKWIPDVVTAVTRAFDHVLDSRAALVYIPNAVTCVTRAADQMIDGTVVALRSTVFSRMGKKHRPPVGTYGTWVVGSVINGFFSVLNKTVLRSHPNTRDYVATLAAWHDELSADAKRVFRSVSFGLLLLCAGLLIVFLVVLRK